jgi:hypothetical protein
MSALKRILRIVWLEATRPHSLTRSASAIPGAAMREDLTILEQLWTSRPVIRLHRFGARELPVQVGAEAIDAKRDVEEVFATYLANAKNRPDYLEAARPFAESQIDGPNRQRLLAPIEQEDKRGR